LETGEGVWTLFESNESGGVEIPWGNDAAMWDFMGDVQALVSGGVEAEKERVMMSNETKEQ